MKRKRLVTRGNLADRLALGDVRLAAHERLDAERWQSHKEVHAVVEQSLRDYKREANEWRSTLADLRGTFIPKAEFMSEHRALDAKLHGEIAALTTRVETLDARVDANAADIRTNSTEQIARRGVFSDTRNILTTAAILVGAVLSFLIIVDRFRA